MISFTLPGATIWNAWVLNSFRIKEQDRGDWDYKYTLRRLYAGGSKYYTAVIGDLAPESLFDETWGNIHYGYVGRAHAIASDILIGAAILAGGIDTLSDRVSVQKGISLWNVYGRSLTLSQLRGAVRNTMFIYRSDPEPTSVKARLEG